MLYGFASSAVSGQAAGAAIALPPGVEWGPNPALPSGARLAVVAGQPGSAGLYAIRVGFPRDLRVMPHSHPDDRLYTVLSGEWSIGLGTAFDPGRARDLLARKRVRPPGGHRAFPLGAGRRVGGPDCRPGPDRDELRRIAKTTHAGCAPGDRGGRHCQVDEKLVDRPPRYWAPARGVVARIVTGPHDANRQDPHRPMRYDTGRPMAVIRLRISQPMTASLPCPAGLRARRPSPMMDL